MSLSRFFAGCACLLALPAAAEPAWWVEFTGPPAAEAYADALARGNKAAATAAAQDQLARNTAEQARALDALKATHAGKILFRVQRVLNAVALRADASDVPALRALPGVKAVTPLSPVHLQNATSIPFTHLPEVWAALPEGLTGRGVRIGIIDTGIDYLHPDFGGSGDRADYAANDRLITGDVPYPTAKVVGGYDFVGDAYNPTSDDDNLPIPDLDPMDQHGHGTHVAGTAAGFGVTPALQTYTGGYAADIPASSLLIGPGTAPEALLFALKVFGIAGETEVLAPAIEWAVDPNGDGDFSDRLDVINMSLGEEYGRADMPNSIAAENAARLGVVVVVAAGNDGDSYGLVVSPGTAPSTISVAACEHLNPANTNLTPDRLTNFSSRGPATRTFGEVIAKPDLTAPGAAITSAALGSATATVWARSLSGTSMACPHVAGAAALVRQLHPDWTPRQVKALLMNNASDSVKIFLSSGTAIAPVTRGGAGRLDGTNLATGTVLAYADDAEDTVTLNFGALDVPAPDPQTFTRDIVLENTGDTDPTATPALAPFEAVPGVTLALDTTPVPVPAHGTARVTLSITVNPTLLQQPREKTAAVVYGGFYRHFLTEVMGSVRFTLADGPRLTVPYYAVVRPIGNVVPTVAELREPELPDFINFEGDDLDITGTFPVQSLVSPFELLCASPVLALEDPAERIADIRMVGASLSVDANGNRPDDPYLNFGIATAAPWMTPHSVRFYVFIDTNFDDTIDFVVRNAFTRGNVGGGTYADAFTSELYDGAGTLKAVRLLNSLPPAGASAGTGANTALMRSNVMVLPLRLGDLKLPENQRSIRCFVESVISPWTSLTGLRFVDTVPEQPDETATTRWLHVSVQAPGLAFPTALGAAAIQSPRRATLPMGLYFDPEGYSREGVFDAAGERLRPPFGVLLLQHHNLASATVQTVPLLSAGDADGDGLPDTAEGAEDPDGDAIPNFADSDSDGDGIPDATEGSEDIDGDSLPNYQDLDSDADTLPDAVEFSGGASDPFLADTDGDGLDDATDGTEDIDADTLSNARDLDSDGDGIPDQIEALADPDGDMLPAFRDLDSDGDGIPDATDGAEDIEGDGVPNYLDTDSDNDGLDDGEEAALGTDQNSADTDGDLVSDAEEVAATRDPLQPDAPARVEGVAATDANCAVQITWPPALGAAEYRVLRESLAAGATPGLAPLSDWTTAREFSDTTAELSRPQSRHGCHVEPARNFPYAYYVEARNIAGPNTPSEPATATRTCPIE